MADKDSLQQPDLASHHTSTDRLHHSPIEHPASAECAKFEGSFAVGGRPKLQRQIWFKRREYFLGGWKEPEIWKSAVGQFSANGFNCLYLKYLHPIQLRHKIDHKCSSSK
jgi:hypothetical protein